MLTTDITIKVNYVPVNKFELTSREIQILNMLADGHTYAEIRVILGLKPRTVRVYMHNALQKSESKNIMNLLAKYLGYIE